MGGKHSTSTSTVSIPKEVLARYNAVNARAETAASKPWTSYGNTASDYVAQMNAQQNAGINDINATAGSYQPYMTQATQATQAGMGPAYAGIENYMSPYIKNVADTTGAYMRQQQEQAQSGALGTAAMSGAFGGDRAGIAAANLQQQNQMGYGKTMADIMNQGYTQALGASQADLARQLQGGAQMAQLGSQSQQLGLQGAQAKIAAGTMQQQTEQAGKDAMIQRFMQEQGYPFQTAQFLANIAMGTGAAQGSTTTTQTPVGIFGNLATGGRVGGYADGGGVAGPRTYSQGTIGGEGYVPVGDLPIGELMVAQPPQQGQDDNTGKILQLIASSMGAAHGGAIDQRHGYATDGGVHDYSTEALRRDMAIRNSDPEEQRRQQLANISAAIGRTATNPANMGLSGYTMPAPTTTGVVPVEAKVQPERFGQPEPASIDNLGEQMRQTPPFLKYNYQKAQFGRNLGAHAPAESTPTDDMAGSFAAGEPRASERYMVPTGLNPAADYEAAHRVIASQAYGDQNPDTAAKYTMPTGLGDFQAASRPRYEIPNSLGSPTAFGLPPGPPPQGGGIGYTLPTGLVAPSAVNADAMKETKVTPSLSDGLSNVPDVSALPVSAPQTDTGVVPKGGYSPIVPLKTQLQFVTNELQQPQYRGYLEQKYATPEEAAVQFESVYEKSGGAGNDVASANARSIFDAARNGNLDSLPPNVTEAYNHFVQNGMDPVQAAGATGRLMVESYARLDPNARNTLGGGNGTFGIAQWRGSRMEDLAKFAGVPLDALTGAPVSTPEGRYYSTGAKADGGLGGADMTAGQQALAGGVKPYEDRNMIGKFFHDPATGKINPNAVMSLLSGLGTMAATNTISPVSAILQGIAGGNATYKELLKQTPEVAAKNLENMRNIQMDTMTYNEMNGTSLTPQQYASMTGASYQMPMGTGRPVTGDKMTWGQYQNGVVQVGDRAVKMQDDPASIQKFISDNSMFPPESPIGQQVIAAQTHLNAINTSGGMTVDASGQQFQVPGYTEVGNIQAKSDADRIASAKFREEAPVVINNAGQQLAAVSTLEGVYTKMEPGKFANVGAEAGAILSALDPSNITGWGAYDLTDPAQYEIAMKGAGEIMANRLRNLPGGAPSAEIDMLQAVTPTPNMQPAAIKKLLAITKAEAKYRMDFYNSYDPAIHGNDVTAYAKKFADEGRTFEKYVKDAMASMPRFAGEGIEPSAAEAELIKRGYTKDANGNWSKP